jgi:hypothetical protein
MIRSCGPKLILFMILMCSSDSVMWTIADSVHDLDVSALIFAILSNEDSI